jgi:hypothetical protein
LAKLIIINGTMGIGKTTVGRLLFTSLQNCAYLDGDAVWQINPFAVTDRTKVIVEKNIPFVLRSYFEAGYDYVILTWVMHRQEIIDTILAPLRDLHFDIQIFTLVADDEVAVARALARDGQDKRDPAGVLDRLHQSRQLQTNQIDTTCQTAEETVAYILEKLALI